jgi:hypothetical protein
VEDDLLHAGEVEGDGHPGAAVETGEEAPSQFIIFGRVGGLGIMITS